MEIDAIEDIDAFWRNLGSRNKLYRVYIGDKLYKDMTLTYEKGVEGEHFKFKSIHQQ